MPLDLPDVSTIITLVAVLTAVAGLFMASRRGAKTSPICDDSVADAEDGLTVVQFELAEIPAIRSLLGQETATGLLEGLMRKVASLGTIVSPPELGPNSMVISLDTNDLVTLTASIKEITARLSESLSVNGATFNCSVRAAVLSDTGYAMSGASLLPFGRNRDTGKIDGPSLRMELLRGLQAGMANGEVTLSYQPKLDLRAGTISSAEALLRWTRPNGQQANIGELVALCEQTGTIKDLTRWTVAKAIADSEQFLTAGYSLLIFVNISGSLLADADFADHLLDMVSKSEAQIGIEITETAVIADPDIAISNLNRFAQAGIAIAIDDFGAGLSSLEYLQRLPASELKIDRGFIAELSSSNRNPLIIRATIDLAHALDMQVTAEGVDDDLSMALLKVMGCDLAQGYLISRPVDPLSFIDFLRSYDGRTAGESSFKAAK